MCGAVGGCGGSDGVAAVELSKTKKAVKTVMSGQCWGVQRKRIAKVMIEINEE